ncbi:MAG: hypothetical protein B6242_16305 [Anaerolineaceae bacterium 4572_78]|nr:MAG: hypothetical protein B6242_16305 [Anaerolineaceae bacterium 4572_78]
MKVCVGQRTFNDSIIGSARDDLRNCVDEELGKFSSVFGATLANVVVPDVVLSDDVRSRLDAIVQSRLETEKAAQDKLKADAESAAEQARQEGEIRVQQSRIQEESKQQTLLAELEQKKILSQKSVIEAERANELARVEAEQAIIEAQKINELLAAEKDLEINQAMAKAAVEKAKADLAYQQILAGIYDKNPGLLNLRIVQANADALKATDKLIFTPEGTVPNIVIPGSGVLPTINTAPVSP